MGTRPTKAKQPAAPAADLLKAAKPASANDAKLSEEEVLAYLEAQAKGSDILKRARNTIWRKIAAKEPKPELVQAFREAVKTHGFNECKLAWNVVRKDSAPAKPEAEEQES